MVKDWMLSPYYWEQGKYVLFHYFIQHSTGISSNAIRQEKETKVTQI